MRATREQRKYARTSCESVLRARIVLRMTTTLARIAHLVEHTYPDVNGRTQFDKPFWIVICGECHAGLNSGHHYTADVKHYAEALAAEHNRTVHRTVECANGCGLLLTASRDSEGGELCLNCGINGMIAKYGENYWETRDDACNFQDEPCGDR